LLGGLLQTAKHFDVALKELVCLIQNDLAPPIRVCLASMITLHMHQKEAFDELVKAKIKDLFDFEWQKQLRADWKSEEDRCVVQIMDTPMAYQNEYLGCKERLVITPLTSRCYITIFQALSMHLGVATFGSSTAGKTMVIKDIGRALGQYVVVVNCSSQLGVSGLSKILKGVAMAGARYLSRERAHVEIG
jgi:dynein heavy chain